MVSIFGIKRLEPTTPTTYSLFQLQKNLKRNCRTNPNYSVASNFTMSEQKLLDSIHSKTKQWNQNNVTRTHAYLDYYQRHPEIHWALLAHMVSRNAGWNMTDLKGEFLSKLLSEKEQKGFFLLLERGNWVIFQDAYPQLLLYEESLKKNRSLFHLLPYFHVSRFMEMIWKLFWKRPTDSLLAIALVVNEQNYLEQQVIQNKFFQSKVLHSIEFYFQNLFGLNHILFPMDTHLTKTKMVGQTLHDFHSLHERILLGKRLYFILFNDKNRLKNILSWANKNPHTGSRSDYWPHLFHYVKETLPGRLYNPQIKNCVLKEGASRLFSPKLQFTWKTVEHLNVLPGDWFSDLQVLNYLKQSNIKVDSDIEPVYCKTLEALSLVVFTKKAIFHRKQ